MRSRRRVLALALFLIPVGMTVYGLVSLVTLGSELIPDRPSFLDVLIFTAIFMTLPTVGLVVAWQRPEHPVGWLFLLVGFGLSTAVFSTEYSGRAVFAGEDLPGAAFIAWLGSWAWAMSAGLALPLAIILFPDGRLPGPRWRTPVAVGIGAMALAIGAVAIDPRPIQGYGGRIANPFAVGGPIGDLAMALVEPGIVAILGMAALAVGAIVVRFRRSRGVERQQLKWLLYPMALFVTSLAVAILTTAAAAWSAALAALAGVASGVGIAILRHRLFDIDLVIRRTIVYGAVVAILGVAYVGLALGLQSLLSGVTGNDTLPVAVSTLAIAALFGPVRARVRALVDRRFYRSRYDAQRTIETFAARLRGEVELDALGTALVGVAERAVRPNAASLWIRRGAGR